MNYFATHNETEKMIADADDREEVRERRMEIEGISLDRIEEAVYNGNMIGFCLSCKREQLGVPSMQDSMDCEHCGEFDIYSAELLLEMISDSSDSLD